MPTFSRLRASARQSRSDSNTRSRIFRSPSHAALYAMAALLACAVLLATSFAARGVRASAPAKARQTAPQPTASDRKGRASHDAAGGMKTPDDSTRAAISSAYGRLPLGFVANGGQFDERVKFSSRGDGYQLFLTPTEAVLALSHRAERKDGDATHKRATQAPMSVATGEAADSREQTSRAVLHTRLLGARDDVRVHGEEPLPGRINFLIGDDSSKWRTGVESFAAVRYEGVYPGVDLVYYGNQRQLEYDFRLAPRVDPSRIRVKFTGARSLATTADGRLLARFAGGYVVQRQPDAYQIVGGVRREVSCRYVVSHGVTRFALGIYDHDQPLVIDPVLSYATFIGGSGDDQANGVAVDQNGNAYIAGQTFSTNFPVANPIQGAFAGSSDAFVVKLNPAGTALVYSTYLGGSASDIGYGIAVDAGGAAYVTGTTGSSDFPHTGGAIQPAKSGSFDAFVAKLNADGSSLAYSTFLGGVNSETGYGVGVDAAGNAYVVGAASSPSINGTTLPKHGSPAYKSADSGASWSAIKNGTTDVAFNSITVDPTNGSTLYAAGTVVFKSTDGGATWSATPPLVVSPTFNIVPRSVAVDPVVPATLYASTQLGVYKSTDAGASWTPSSNGLGGSAFSVNTVLVDPSNHTTLYAGTFRGVYKSTDGGATWAAANAGLTLSPPQILKLAFDPTNTATIYAATSRGFFKSINSAANWGGAVDINGMPVVSVVVDPSAPATIYAATRLGVSKSTDGGAHWLSPSNNGLNVTVEGTTYVIGVNALAINPLAPATIYAATNLGVYKTTDGAVSWSPTNGGLANLTVKDVVVDRTTPTNLYVATSGGGEAFVAKLNASGTAFGYLLYLGGDENDYARGVAVDAAGNAYVAGATSSANFPVANAEQPTYGGEGDAFAAKLTPDGSVVYSTYLGGSNFDEAAAVAVDSAGRAYVTGDTLSATFPVTDTRKPHDSIFYDAFVTRLSPSGSTLDYSFLLGGAGNDQGFGIAADATGNAYVTGLTSSADFPASGATQVCSNSGLYDTFVTKLDPSSAVAYSICIGGGDNDQGLAITTDGNGAAYVVGSTASSNFPTSSTPLQPALGGSTDAFAVRIGSAADLSVAVEVPRDTVMVGSSLTYTITVANSGPSKTTATLTDALPASAALVSASPSQGSCTGTTNITCTLGEMTAASTATITITVSPSAPGALSNTVSVVGTEFDPNAANNTATRSVNVSAHPSIAGKVSGAGGSTFSGVDMSLTGSQSAATTTDARGYYQFTELADGGNYVVTPSKAGFTFTPLSRSFDNLRQDATADFAAAQCSYSISPASQTFADAGGTGSITVTANGDCPWTASSSADWITITSGAGGRGGGTVNFSVAPTNAPRSGHLTVAGQTFAVWQEFDFCGASSFQQGHRYLLSIQPTGLVTADFNNDGKLDLAALQELQGQNQIAVLLGNGAGGFGAPTYFNAGGNNRALTFGDLNGDGNVDLIATDLFTIQLFFGNGAGGFSAPTNLSLSNRFHYSVSVADFNHDGKPDLAVSYQTDNLSDVVSVVLGDGAGHFGAPLNVFNGFVVAVADFNNDGKPDLALTNSSVVTNTLSVRLGDGAGNFGAPINTPFSNLDARVTPYDVNGDGNLDLVGALGTLLGNGSGGFGAFIPVAGVSQNYPSTVADFNNDAKPDLAVFTAPLVSVSPGVSVFPGDGTGHFGAATVFALDTQAFSPVIGDFNGDGHADLATANFNSSSVFVLLNGCHADPGVSITGKVTDAGGNGIFAIVALSSAKLGTITTQTDFSGNYAFRNLARDDDYTISPRMFPYNFLSQSVSHPNADTVVNFTAVSDGIRFGAASYQVGEGGGHATLFVTRTGNVTQTQSVSFATVDDPAAVRCDDTVNNHGAAYARCDYATTVDTLTFAPNETQKAITIPIIDDAHVEGDETFQVRLSNPQGTTLGSPSVATVTIKDNDVAGEQNPYFNTDFFVRQQYLDLLSREPEAGQPWTNVLNGCPDQFNGNPNPDPNVNPSARCDRIAVSYSFFASPEFQLKGAFVFRFYKASFGRLPHYAEIVTDMRSVTGQTPQEVFDKKAAFTNAWIARTEFKSLYDAMTNAQFVNALMDRYQLQQITTPDPAIPDGSTKITLTRVDLTNRLAAGTLSRAQVVRAVADSDEVSSAEFNSGFVAMQYFGYLRRDPDAGYDDWLNYLTAHPGDFRTMVFGFVYSPEYKLRFGQP